MVHVPTCNSLQANTLLGCFLKRYDVIDVSKHFLVNLQALSDCLYLIKNVNLGNLWNHTQTQFLALSQTLSSFILYDLVTAAVVGQLINRHNLRDVEPNDQQMYWYIVWSSHKQLNLHNVNNWFYSSLILAITNRMLSHALVTILLKNN